jgi:hypothetical protein
MGNFAYEAIYTELEYWLLKIKKLEVVLRSSLEVSKNR